MDSNFANVLYFKCLSQYTINDTREGCESNIYLKEILKNGQHTHTNLISSIYPDMANVREENGQESDEDYEVYFLKPVNEYNIVDKIKEANKELFSDEIGVESTLIGTSQPNRKVSFAANLEEYEPQNEITLKELEEKLREDCNDSHDKNRQNDREQKLEVIVEEEAMNEVPQNKGNLEESLSAMEKNEAGESGTENYQLESLTKCTNDDREIILEEICKEILKMEMENDKEDDENSQKFASTIVNQRKILKQITFDFADEENEKDKSSSTNLIICNKNDSYDEKVDYQEHNCNESINDDTDTQDKVLSTNTDYYTEDEEDDKLSIIVASYGSDDMVWNKTSITPSTIKSSARTCKPRKFSFNRRYSFRRKTNSSNAIGSCSNQRASNNHRFIPPPELTDLKLQDKSCCDLKNIKQKLPNYAGYFSEYGLSKEQLIEREHRLQQKHRGRIIETLKTSEAAMRKMHDNERAFTTWLKNKMRFPRNKTRNMFDVNRPFGLKKYTSLGGNNTNVDSAKIFSATKYGSVSAKLRNYNKK